MPNFRRLVSRRSLLGFLAAAVLLFGLAMLHPYPRQSLFGPTIRGEPWCVWEQEARDYVHDEWGEPVTPSFWVRAMRWLGFRRRVIRRDEGDYCRIFRHKEMLPLLLFLAQDDDPAVKSHCYHAVLYCEVLHQEPALPLLRHALYESHPSARVHAGKAIWRMKRDKDVIVVFQHILKFERTQAAVGGNMTAPPNPRLEAIAALIEISQDAPEVIAEIRSCENDQEDVVRAKAQAYLGKIAVKGDGMNCNRMNSNELVK